jgi:hypothetical protein
VSGSHAPARQNHFLPQNELPYEVAQGQNGKQWYPAHGHANAKGMNGIPRHHLLLGKDLGTDEACAVREHDLTVLHAARAAHDGLAIKTQSAHFGFLERFAIGCPRQKGIELQIPAFTLLTHEQQHAILQNGRLIRLELEHLQKCATCGAKDMWDSVHENAEPQGARAKPDGLATDSSKRNSPRLRVRSGQEYPFSRSIPSEYLDPKVV